MRALRRLIALGSFALIGAAPMPNVPPAEPDTAETIATATDIAARMTVPTSINGEGPFQFTVDTAADRSVISDGLAQRLGLVADGKVLMHGIIGPSTVATVRLDKLRVGRSERRSIAAPILSERALGARGFLGLDALAGQSVVFDFARKRIVLARSAQEAMVDDPETIVVTGRSKYGQLILTDGNIAGVKVVAIVDTGAQNTIGNLALRRMLGAKGPLPIGRGEVIGVTGATLPAEPGTVPRIRLGGLHLANMPISFADVSTFRHFGVDDRPAILIGMDVLRGFERVAIDFKRREVRFRVGTGTIGRG